MAIDWAQSECRAGRLHKITGNDDSGSAVTIGIASALHFPQGFTGDDGTFYHPREYGWNMTEDLGTFRMGGRSGFLRREGTITLRIDGKDDPLWDDLDGFRIGAASITTTLHDWETGDEEIVIVGHLPEQRLPIKAGTFQLRYIDGVRAFEERYSPEIWHPDDLRGNSGTVRRYNAAAEQFYSRRIVFGRDNTVTAPTRGTVVYGFVFGGLSSSDPTTGAAEGAACGSWNKPTTLDLSNPFRTYRPGANTSVSGVSGEVDSVYFVAASADESYQQTTGRSVPMPYVKMDFDAASGTPPPVVDAWFPRDILNNIMTMEADWGSDDQIDQIDYVFWDTGSDDNDGYLQLGTGARDAVTRGDMNTHLTAAYRASYIVPSPKHVKLAECPLFWQVEAERAQYCGFDFYWKNSTGANVHYWKLRTHDDTTVTRIQAHDIIAETQRSYTGMDIGEYANRFELRDADRLTLGSAYDTPSQTWNHYYLEEDATEQTRHGVVEFSHEMKWLTASGRTTAADLLSNFEAVATDRAAELSRLNQWVSVRGPHKFMGAQYQLLQEITFDANDFAAVFQATAAIRKRVVRCSTNGLYEVELHARQSEGIYTA